MKRGGVRLNALIEKLVEVVLRGAAGMKYDDSVLPTALRERIPNLISRIATQLREDSNGILRCKVCGRGPFTKRGFYLHAKRIHSDYVSELVREEIEGIVWEAKLGSDRGRDAG
ncbi:MAG: hypothetical protein ABWW70_06595 [Thermoproteota archaeon]